MNSATLHTALISALSGSPAFNRIISPAACSQPLPDPSATPRMIESLHFLVHPLFLADPNDMDKGEREMRWTEGNELAGLYLEKARALPENGLMFLFSHVWNTNSYRANEPYIVHYVGLLKGLEDVLGDRLFIKDDNGLLEGDLSVAATLNKALRRRGFQLVKDPQAFACGEVADVCVARAAESLSEGFDLKKQVIVEGRYTNYQESYSGGSPGLENQFRKRGLILR